MTMPENSQLLKVIANTTQTDYDLVHVYSRIDECCEVIRLNAFLSVVFYSLMVTY